jgi:hypothetical protein
MKKTDINLTKFIKLHILERNIKLFALQVAVKAAYLQYKLSRQRSTVCGAA